MTPIQAILIFIVSLGPISAASGSDTTPSDRCTADTSKYTETYLKSRTPIFDVKAKNIANAFPSKLIRYGFEDRVKLKNGVEVIFTVGGCDHYGYRFVFIGKNLKPVRPSEKRSRAESLLKSLALTSSEERNMLLDALANSKKKPVAKPTEVTVFLPCGDAVCDLVDQDNQRVEIGYSFPL